MGWMQKLYETYDHIKAQSHLLLDKHVMPLFHTKQNAHIEIVLNTKGQFLRAKLFDKAAIVMPASEKSASRSSGVAPHGLTENLRYLGGYHPDIEAENKGKDYLGEYMQQLRAWCESEYAHSAAQSVLAYKQTIIDDLVTHKVLHLQEGKLYNEWLAKTEKPEIFKISPEQLKSMVCWSVESPDITQPQTWLDSEVQQAWIDFAMKCSDKKDICLVTGECSEVTSSHPAKLRHTGDAAKLISSNDNTGLTYKGRFYNAEQAQAVSSVATQKAHHALSWLLQHQSYRQDDYYFTAWAVSCKKIPAPLKLDDFFALPECEEQDFSDIGQSYAKSLQQFMQGYLAEKALTADDTVS